MLRRSDLTPERAIPRTKGEVEKQFTSQHSYNYIPSNRAKCTYFNWRVYSYCSSSLEEADLHRYSTENYTYGHATCVHHAYGDRQYYIRNSARRNSLRKRISLRKKYSYCHEHLHERSALTEKPTPRLKHIYDEKLSSD
jgi:hypothetical protein